MNPVMATALILLGSPGVAQPAADQTVVSLTLIDVGTGEPVPGFDPIPDGATLDLAKLPTRRLNIRAKTRPEKVGSVRFSYDGEVAYRTENTPPYAAGGDDGTRYETWTPTPGKHTLTATPFSAAGAGGNAGTPLTITFTVEDTPMPLPSPPGPAFPGADWQVATPESQGVDPDRLKAAVEYLADALHDWGDADTLFIVRNGRVVWAGPACDQEYQIFSATKSFTSTCLGLLIEDGQCSLDTRAAGYTPALAAQYPDVTLRHFATMTSGYDAAPVQYETDADGKGDSWIPDPPAAPLFAPGTRFRYWDEAMMQFGNTLAKIAGQPLDVLFRARIADPIGMTRRRWDPGSWTGGIHTSSRELARFGLLFLNRGNWNGKQLVNADWVDQATAVQVPATIPNDVLPRSRGAGVYGYNWWVNGVKPDGQLLWPQAPPGAYYANGLHNNVCIVIPDWNVVIARTNGPRADGSTSSPPNVDEIWSAFLGRLGEALRRKTEVSIQGDAFRINGRPTYEGRTWQGHKIEGLLLNSRMVQGIFDDLNPETVGRWAYPDTGKWDPERNTREFIAAMPEWRKHGLLAFTINLQGGSPEGYSGEQPWHNSAISEDGSLRPEYMGRLERIIGRADELGMVAILGIFYFGQDQRLRDEAAVVRALDNAIEWVLDHDYRNVLIEVNNECNVRYDHAILQPERVHELIERVRLHTRNGRRLLVSASYGGGTVPQENVVRAADFLLIHGNGVSDPERLAEMVRKTRQVSGYHPMPILVNEDDHFDFDKPLCNMTAAIGEYCSWGYFHPGDNNYCDGYQSVPTNWGINTDRKRAFFTKLKEITGS
jgi:CubicO group peptidase (beta-lactamase class C family)